MLDNSLSKQATIAGGGMRMAQAAPIIERPKLGPGFSERSSGPTLWDLNALGWVALANQSARLPEMSHQAGIMAVRRVNGESPRVLMVDLAEQRVSA